MSESEVQSARFNGSAEDVAPLGRSLRAVNKLTPEEQADNDAHDQALEAARRDAMSGTDEAKVRKDAQIRAFADGVEKLAKRLDAMDCGPETRTDAFDEGAHPRASNGQFGSGGGGKKAAKVARAASNGAREASATAADTSKDAHSDGSSEMHGYASHVHASAAEHHLQAGNMHGHAVEAGEDKAHHLAQQKSHQASHDAHARSSDAHKASEDALASPSDEAHRNVYGAHALAKVAHENASHHALKAGDNRLLELHKNMAGEHKKAAKTHGDAIGKTKSSAPKPVDTQAAQHKSLSAAGWTNSHNDDPGKYKKSAAWSYRHKDKPGHNIALHPSGGWSHSQQHTAGTPDTSYGKGADHASLHQHLTKPSAPKPTESKAETHKATEAANKPVAPKTETPHSHTEAADKATSQAVGYGSPRYHAAAVNLHQTAQRAHAEAHKKTGNEAHAAAYRQHAKAADAHKFLEKNSGHPAANTEARQASNAAKRASFTTAK